MSEVFDDLEKHLPEDEELNKEELVEEPILEEDEDEDEFEDNDGGFYKTSEYVNPSDRDGFVDTVAGTVKSREDLTPFDIIKSVALQTNTIINDPKKGCRRCYGRGYTGVDASTKSPIPCSCIYPDKSENDKMQEAMYDENRVNTKAPTRQQKRSMKKFFVKEMKKQKKIEFARKKRGFYNPPEGSEEALAVATSAETEQYND